MAEMNTSQQIPFTLVITNAAGEAAPVQGVPVYAVSDETVIALAVATDGMSGNCVAGAPGGPTRFTVSADADLGDGVTTITGVSEDITVVQDPANQASVMTLTLGPPEPKATPQPV